MKLSEIAVDVKAAEEGVRKEHPYWDGVFVVIGSVQSERFRKRRAQLMNRLGNKRRKIGDAVMAQEDIERRALSDIVFGFDGIEDEKGKPIEYSADLVRAWSEDPRYRRFFDGCRELADDVGSEESEAQEDLLRD